PDRAGHRRHCDPDVDVHPHQRERLAADELVQPAHGDSTAMSAVQPFISLREEPQRSAPVRARESVWRSLFGTLGSSLTTVVLLAVLLTTAPKLVSWAVVNGAWSGGPEACRD